jgi:hypothetical protein
LTSVGKSEEGPTESAMLATVFTTEMTKSTVLRIQAGNMSNLSRDLWKQWWMKECWSIWKVLLRSTQSGSSVDRHCKVLKATKK